MNVDTETVDTGGTDTFAQEMDAARAADAALDTTEAGAGAAEGEGAAGEAAVADTRPPLPPEEVAKRLEDQKRATRSERQKRQELEQTLKTVQARLDELAAGGGTQKAASGLGERPSPSEDPIGYLEYVEAIISSQAETQEQTRQQEEAQRRAQEETRAVVSRVEEYEADFRDLNPDYDAAVEHLYAAKKAEYTDSGYDDAEAHSMVMAEFLTRSKRAFSAGKDPAEIVYTLAKRAGYAPQAGTKKLEAIERGQRATSPLSSAGSGATSELTVESVGNLRGAAFDTAFAKLRERAKAIERASGL